MKPDYNNNNIDKAEIGHDGYEINEKLLICLQCFNVNPELSISIAICSWKSVKTYVFKPDSVEALTPKKYASIAARLPYG